MFHTVAAWTIGGIMLVAFFAGTDSAVSVTGNALGTVGVAAGSLLGGVDDLIGGFNDAKGIAEAPAPAEPPAAG